MPELPDVEIYREKIAERTIGYRLVETRLFRPFFLRSIDPPLEATVGRSVLSVRRLGKRVVLALEDDLFLVLHPMIAGRFLWKAPGDKLPTAPGKINQAVLRFESGSLLITEASPKKRASLHVVRGEVGLAAHDRGGLDVRGLAFETFAERLTAKNRTLKRALTDPTTFDGIGNAYSDEILHAARLSPLRLTTALSPEEIARLLSVAGSTLDLWIERLQKEFAGRFPGQGEITAFRPDFSAHGKFGQPCPDCGKPIQRIRYAENETNYCAQCQNEGRMLADRSLSRLLKSDWPRTLEAMLGEDATM